MWISPWRLVQWSACDHRCESQHLGMCGMRLMFEDRLHMKTSVSPARVAQMLAGRFSMPLMGWLLIFLALLVNSKSDKQAWKTQMADYRPVFCQTHVTAAVSLSGAASGSSSSVYFCKCICFSNYTILPLYRPADPAKPCLSCTKWA